MSPSPSPFCIPHSDDEWCDTCFIPTRQRGTLRVLDQIAEFDKAAVAEATETVERAARALRAEWHAGRTWATEEIQLAHPCVNGRHVDGAHYPGGCDRPYPRASLAHRATGAVAVATLVTATAAAVVVAEAWGWWGSVGRLHIEAAKQRAHDAWCRSAG